MRGPSLSSFSKSLILTHIISLAFLLGRNSSIFAFSACSWANAVISHDNSNGYRCCIARSRYDFLALNLTAITFPSLPGHTSVMTLIFHCALFCPLLYMTITSPSVTSGFSCSALNCVSCVKIPCAFVYTFVSFINLYFQYL